MKFELKKYNRNTPDEELISDLKNVAKTIERDTVTIAEYEQHGNYHPSTLQRRFGSWFDILKLANLKPSRSKLNITNDELFKNLEEVWTKLGRQPRYTEMKSPLSKYSSGTYENKFGTWMNGLQIFVDYINDESKEDITKNEVIEIKQTDNSKNIIIHKTKREISDRLRFRILMRDGFTCRSCGKSPMKERGVELHVDHILPWSKGGETVPENLESKCKQCNLGKGNAFEI
jgi:predicted Zn-ribbon and HTH transcriptional regulator